MNLSKADQDYLDSLVKAMAARDNELYKIARDAKVKKSTDKVKELLK